MLLNRILHFVAIGLAGLANPPLAAQPTTPASRPNIVFILADDLGWGDLGVNGHPWIRTPNIDRLAREGTNFHRFTVASPVCSPSRAAILTGQYPARFGIHGHFATVESHVQRRMPDWLDPQVVLLPRLLREVGYATGHFGKWHLTNIMVPDAPRPTAYGYDEYGAFNCSGPQMPVHDDVPRAIAFIEKTRSAGRPFFVNLWIHEPHTPHYPKPEYLERFAHLPDEAPRIYAAVIAHADARIGELVAALARLGIERDTLVIFTSDNGPEVTGPAARRITEDESTGPGLGTFASVGSTGGRRGRKRSLLEGGIGVPFIARWPGQIPAGGNDTVTPLTAVDLLPTICASAGVKLPDGYRPDGVDQSRALRGTPQARRERPAFWQWSTSSKLGESWPALAVRDGDWKLLAGAGGKPLELFQMTADPLEQKNRSTTEPAQVERLRALHAEWAATLPAGPARNCFSAERKN